MSVSQSEGAVHDRRMVTVALRGFKRDVTSAPNHGEDFTPSSTTPLSEALRCSTTVGRDVDALRLSRDQLGAWLRVRHGQETPTCLWLQRTIVLLVRECVAIFVPYFRKEKTS